MSYKIYTENAYYVVSEDSSMAEAELLKLAEEIRQSVKITQPNFLIDMRYDYQLVQLQALQLITEKLQPIIKNNLDNQTSLFIPLPNSTSHSGSKEVEIVIPLQEFGWARQHYGRLRKALYGLSIIHVCYPKWSAQLRQTLFGDGPLCTYVAIHRDTNDKRRELVHFFFSAETAQCLVSPQFGFTKLLKQTLQNSKNVYTTKIYMYICRFADQGKWVISYKKLREILCIGQKFPRYYDFRTRILKQTEEELRQNSNHWFDLVECFSKEDSSAPQLLIFNIYSAQEKYNDFNRLNLYRGKIYETMTESLNIKKSAAQTISRQINSRNVEYIWKKHNMLLSYMAEDDSIQDIKAYYIRSMQQIIQTEKYSQPAQQQSLF